ncbi:MRNIP isoform 12 [Pan troglodytes]|uniref:MRNIP isoform 12 n=1 Tax=Pan troglodytes TaxID=9598 RepID=A0A2J8JTG9_PANTR|nr:MRNIP isoform 12 [Pan troglodytes]
MASLQRSRVLRCCSCRLFQAHQVKKSVKWTCKACGEKQSFLRNLIPSQLEELSLNYKFLGEATWLAQADSDVHLWSSQLGLGLRREGWLTRLMVKALVLTVDAMSKS